jgi:hypothetical protein
MDYAITFQWTVSSRVRRSIVMVHIFRGAKLWRAGLSVLFVMKDIEGHSKY